MIAALDLDHGIASVELNPPLIVRIAGLPAEVMDSFSSISLLEQVSEYVLLQEQLECRKTTLVGCLHAAIHCLPKDKRGFLLSVKRDCFNARRLAKHRENPNWHLVTDAGGDLVSSILELESRIEAAKDRLHELYHCELHREWGRLVQLLEHRAFVRGVTLASPELAQHFYRLREKTLSAFSRKEKRLSLTLLRYASRTALKLSPFSSLTRTGVGLITSEGSSGFELLSTGQWRERSIVRLHRELLAQCLCILLSCPKFIRHLNVKLNDSLESLGDGRYSFFRPYHWEFDEESKSFKYCEEAFVRVKFEGPLVPRLCDELRDGVEVYGQLIQRLESDSNGPDLLEQSISELLGIGLLNLVLPWDQNEPDLEDRILDYLQELLPDASIEAFAESMRELILTLDNYSESGSPLSCIEECRRGVERLFRAVLPLSNLGPSVNFKANNATFKEDVFLLPASDHEGFKAIASLSPRCALNIIQSLDPLARLSSLSSSRHDLLHALARLGSKQWPGNETINFLEFYKYSQPLLREYTRYKSSLLRHPVLLAPGFNPFDLDSVKGLIRSRRIVAGQLGECLRRDDDKDRLCPQALGALLDQVPGPYAAFRDYCAFVQPLDSEGRVWVVNGLFEGYCRLSSRYTSAMDDKAREHWVKYFIPFSFIDVRGERAELVDISYPDRRSLNVHAAQTHRVLRMPGDSSRLPSERLLRLSDLRIRLGGPEGLPVLTDLAGQYLLPVSLGGLSPSLSPTVLKFLAIFGPGEISLFGPESNSRQEGDARVTDRHIIGNVVYRRKKWTIDPQRLLTLLSGTQDSRTFTAVNLWRMKQGIPSRVFAMASPGSSSISRKKPQYIDFSSPSMVQVFEFILAADSRRMTLAEVLPDPGQFPGGNGSWGVELQLETLSVRPRPAFLTSVPRAERGN